MDYYDKIPMLCLQLSFILKTNNFLRIHNRINLWYKHLYIYAYAIIQIGIG